MARLIFILFLLIPCYANANNWIIGTPRVVDGDTIAFGRQYIRLQGIDAPELKQLCYKDNIAWQCGVAAKLFLKQYIDRDTVECRVKEKDLYLRLIAICYVRGSNINSWLVASGWALDYTQYSSNYYTIQEMGAKKNRLGIWGSRFIKPWEWRKNGDKS